MAGLNLLITGRPGVGKTTLVVNVMERLRDLLRLAGFTTVEMRGRSGERTGFQIVTVEGKQAELARAGFRSAVQVGRYGVNLEAFERLALPELARRDADLIVVDEIGKMECASQRFCRSMEEALDAQVSVLATLGISRLPFLECVRNRNDVELFTLTERNRNALVEDLYCRFHRSPH